MSKTARPNLLKLLGAHTIRVLPMAFRKQSLTLILFLCQRERRSTNGSGARIFSKTSSGSTSPRLGERTEVRGTGARERCPGMPANARPFPRFHLPYSRAEKFGLEFFRSRDQSLNDVSLAVSLRTPARRYPYCF